MYISQLSLFYFSFLTDDGNSNPKMLASLQQYLIRNVGETALLECAASGYPQPQISWTRNGNFSHVKLLFASLIRNHPDNIM